LLGNQMVIPRPGLPRAGGASGQRLHLRGARVRRMDGTAVWPSATCARLPRPPHLCPRSALERVENGSQR